MTPEDEKYLENLIYEQSSLLDAQKKVLRYFIRVIQGVLKIK